MKTTKKSLFRKVLCAVMILCMTFSTMAITASAATVKYFFDIETDPFENGWTTIDADGDGYDWNTDTDAGWDKNLGIDGGHCAYSMSYLSGTGSRNANNWMFSPAIKVPAGGATVSWYEKSQDPNWPDAYTVYVSETNTSTDPSGMTVICATHKAAGSDAGSDVQTIDTWTQKTVELSAKDYAGKTVYIAFQHQDFDCFYLKIDNFAVEVEGGADGNFFGKIGNFFKNTGSSIGNFFKTIGNFFPNSLSLIPVLAVLADIVLSFFFKRRK